MGHTFKETMHPADFLEGIYGEFSEHGFLTLVYESNFKPKSTGKSVHWLSGIDRESIEEFCKGSRDEANGAGYFGLGLRKDELGGRRRGKSSEVSAIYLIGMDIDHKEAAIKKKTDANYLTKEQSDRAIAELPLPPSVRVKSGGGEHIYWVFHDPFIIKNSDDRTFIEGIIEGWFRVARESLIRNGGGKLDAVHDLSRVLRLPWSWNARHGRYVTVQDGFENADNWHRYEVSDFEDYRVEIKTEYDKKSESMSRVGVHDMNPDARPPAEMLNALLINDDDFRLVWERKNDTSKWSKVSSSEYDLSIATRLKGAGWDDQDIVNAMICHRRRHEPETLHERFIDMPHKARRALAIANESVEKNNASDLLDDITTFPMPSSGQRQPASVSKKKKAVASESAKNDSKTDGESGSEPESDKPANDPTIPQYSKKEILDAISLTLGDGIEITGWIQYGVDNPIFAMKLSHPDTGREIIAPIGGASDVIRSSAAFESAMLCHVQRVIRSFKNKEWKKIVMGLTRVVEIVNDEMSSDSGFISDTIRSRFGDCEIAKTKVDVEGICQGQAKSYIYNNKLHLRLADLLNEVGRQMTRQKVISVIRELGFKMKAIHYATHDGGTTTASYYVRDNASKFLQGGVA